VAGNHHFLTRLRLIVKTLDDEALATLANKGLLRRAQKDLEAGKPSIVSVETDMVRLQVADATVAIPELPAKSKCSCPATGICRHILSALLYLRDDPGLAAADAPTQGTLFQPDAVGSGADAPAKEETAPFSPEEALANLSDDELQKWAGKALLKKAHKALAALASVDIEVGQSLVVRFPTRNITCRWIPSGGLLGMVCSCQAETVCEHVVTAVLAYQQSLGKRQAIAEQTLLTESVGAPRTRNEVLASVGRVLCEMMALGLARLSAATSQRLTTLAISAHGVDLPRLERMLASLAQEIELSLKRDARASTQSLFSQAARVEALRAALTHNPLASLVGQHRTSYHEVGQLTLVGLGAQRWRSKGGYHGLTVYSWDQSARGWATWSESRPIDQAMFDPAARFRADGPWAGCSSPQEASRSVLRLTSAFRNSQGRISGRPATRALVIGPSLLSSTDNGQKSWRLTPEVPSPMVNWSALTTKVQMAFSTGLADRPANAELVLLSPKSWGLPQYDSLRQELIRPIFDEVGRPLNLWLPFTPENEAAIEVLEQHDPSETIALLGALRLVAGRICLQPISLLEAGNIVHLNLDLGTAATVASKFVASANASNGAEDEQLLADDEPEATNTASRISPLARLVVTAQAELEAIAEGGVSGHRDMRLLVSASQRLESLGLTACGRPMARLNDCLARSASLDEPKQRDAAAANLLHAYYVLSLAADQESIAIATSSLA
jgi:hypothetical protein